MNHVMMLMQCLVWLPVKVWSKGSRYNFNRFINYYLLYCGAEARARARAEHKKWWCWSRNCSHKYENAGAGAGAGAKILKMLEPEPVPSWSLRLLCQLNSPEYKPYSKWF